MQELTGLVDGGGVGLTEGAIVPEQLPSIVQPSGRDGGMAPLLHHPAAQQH